jgi:hypothetical protein
MVNITIISNNKGYDTIYDGGRKKSTYARTKNRHGRDYQNDALVRFWYQISILTLHIVIHYHVHPTTTTKYKFAIILFRAVLWADTCLAQKELIFRHLPALQRERVRGKVVNRVHVGQ